MATIAESLADIEQYITEAWAAVQTKGGIVASQKNLANIITALNPIGIETSDTPEVVPENPTVIERMASLAAHLTQIYDQVEAKNGIVPMPRNFKNLAGAILSIPKPYGYLTYTTDEGGSAVYTLTSAAEMKKLDAKGTYITEPYTITLDNLTIQSTQPTAFEFTALGAAVIVDNFMAGCANLTTVTGTELMTRVGTSFCASCPKLNCPLYYPGSFSQSGTTVWSGTYFLANCTSFNSPITFAPNITTTGEMFLSQCSAFNQPLELPASLTSIGPDFLYKCDAYNQPITIPNKVTSIGINFLYSDAGNAFNSALTLPASLKTINRGFLHGCVQFNQPLTVPDSLTSIGIDFMYANRAFTQPLTLPANLVTLGYRFMTSAYNFTGPLWVPAGVSYTEESGGASSLGVLSNNRDKPMYATGVTVTGPGASELKAAYPNGQSGIYYRNLL